MLTEKKEAYIQNRLRGMTQRQAYRAAYNAEKMSDSTADKRACELEKSGEVAGRLKALQQEARKAGEAAAVASAVEVLQELTNIAMGRKTYAATDMHGNERQRPPTVSARLRALELLSKYHGLLTERVQVAGTAAVQIVDDLEDEHDKTL